MKVTRQQILDEQEWYAIVAKIAGSFCILDVARCKKDAWVKRRKLASFIGCKPTFYEVVPVQLTAFRRLPEVDAA